MQRRAGVEVEVEVDDDPQQQRQSTTTSGSSKSKGSSLEEEEGEGAANDKQQQVRREQEEEEEEEQQHHQQQQGIFSSPKLSMDTSGSELLPLRGRRGGGGGGMSAGSSSSLSGMDVDYDDDDDDNAMDLEGGGGGSRRGGGGGGSNGAGGGNNNGLSNTRDSVVLRLQRLFRRQPGSTDGVDDGDNEDGMLMNMGERGDGGSVGGVGGIGGVSSSSSSFDRGVDWSPMPHQLHRAGVLMLSSPSGSETGVPLIVQMNSSNNHSLSDDEEANLHGGSGSGLGGRRGIVICDPLGSVFDANAKPQRGILRPSAFTTPSPRRNVKFSEELERIKFIPPRAGGWERAALHWTLPIFALLVLVLMVVAIILILTAWK